MNSSDLIVPYRDLIKKFSRKEYEKSFMEYEDKCKEIIKYLQNGYDESEDKLAYLKAEADIYISEVKRNSLEDLTLKKNKARKAYEDYRLVTLFYCLPMLLRANGYASKKFVEVLKDNWTEAKLIPTTFEKLNNGFRSSFFEGLFKKNNDN